MHHSLDLLPGVKQSLWAAKVSIVSNVIFAVVKLIAGVVGSSYALVADAVESMIDVGGSLALLGGLRVAATPADDDHPYGHGKAEPLTAAALALFMVVAAFVIAAECIREIVTPHKTPAAWTLIVLVAVVATKEGLFRYLTRLGRAAGSTAVQVDAWHHRSDALTSGAAFVGISIAVICGPGYENADDWAALLTCFVIVWNAYRLSLPAIADIMDAAPEPEVFARIRAVGMAVPGVVDLEKCFVRRYGNVIFVDLHVQVDGAMAVRDAHEVAHQVKNALVAADLGVADVLVHLEPADEPAN